MRVRLTHRAQRDLAEIHQYLEARNPEAADRVVDRLERRCRTLADYSERGTPLRRLGYSGLRRLVEMQYLIIYDVLGNETLVVRVLHGARDFDTALIEEPPSPEED